MTSQEYAALHAQMVRQRAERRWLGVGLRPGDLVQVHVGGEIREVTERECAGSYVYRKAMERPAHDHERSAAGACALYGGSSHWTKE